MYLTSILCRLQWIGCMRNTSHPFAPSVEVLGCLPPLVQAAATADCDGSSLNVPWTGARTIPWMMRRFPVPALTLLHGPAADHTLSHGVSAAGLAGLPGPGLRSPSSVPVLDAFQREICIVGCQRKDPRPYAKCGWSTRSK